MLSGICMILRHDTVHILGLFFVKTFHSFKRSRFMLKLNVANPYPKQQLNQVFKEKWGEKSD